MLEVFRATRVFQRDQSTFIDHFNFNRCLEEQSISYNAPKLHSLAPALHFFSFHARQYCCSLKRELLLSESSVPTTTQLQPEPTTIYYHPRLQRSSSNYANSNSSRLDKPLQWRYPEFRTLLRSVYQQQSIMV